jgi:hypothetical protein
LQAKSAPTLSVVGSHPVSLHQRDLLGCPLAMVTNRDAEFAGMPKNERNVLQIQKSIQKQRGNTSKQTKNIFANSNANIRQKTLKSTMRLFANIASRIGKKSMSKQENVASKIWNITEKLVSTHMSVTLKNGANILLSITNNTLKNQLQQTIVGML